MDEDLDVVAATARFGRGVAKLEEFRKIGDTEAVEEVRTLLLRVVSELLLAHARGQAQLPANVALWLHMEVDQIVRGKPKNLSTLIEVTATSYAAGYILRGPGGDARGAKTKRVREVVEHYGVSDRRAFDWKEERPAFAAVMAQLQPGQDADAFARQYLRDMGEEYRAGRQPLGK